MTDSYAKYWCFTAWPQPATQDADADQQTAELESSLKTTLSGEEVDWAIFQMEKCDQTGRLHFQGALALKTRKRMAGVKALTGGPRTHVEKMKGSCRQSKDYCSKDHTAVPGTQWEHGTCPEQTQGRRSDLARLAETIKGDGLNAAIEESPENYIRYHKGMLAYSQYCSDKGAPKRRCVRVIVVYQDQGEGGGGKSTWAEAYDPDETWVAGDKVDDRLQGYTGQRTIVVDEMGKDERGKDRIPYFRLKLLLDENVQKWWTGEGTSVAGVWDTVILTSNQPPWTWYKTDIWFHNGQQMSPLERRINFIYRVTGCYTLNTATWYKHGDFTPLEGPPPTREGWDNAPAPGTTAEAAPSADTAAPQALSPNPRASKRARVAEAPAPAEEPEPADPSFPPRDLAPVVTTPEDPPAEGERFGLLEHWLSFDGQPHPNDAEVLAALGLLEELGHEAV